MTGFTTELERELDTTPETVEPGDHEKLSHYAKKDDIMRAMVEGTPCRALCGKYWIPTRDPEKFPVCPTCQEILDKFWPQS